MQNGIVIGSTPASLDIDVRASRVSVALTINGAKVPSSQKSGSCFSLRNDAGDRVDLVFGDGSTDTTTSSGVVAEGTYDLYYGGYASDKPVAVNQSIKVLSGVVVGASPLSLAVDVKATTVSGKLTVDGGAPAGARDAANLLSLRTAAGDLAPLLSDANGAFSALVVPGTYDLYYRASSVSSPGPIKLRSGVVVGSAPIGLDVDVPVTVVSGEITPRFSLTGLPDSSNPSSPFGVVGLASLDRLAFFRIGAVPRDVSYSIGVQPGTYDLVYEVVGNGIGVPSNSYAPLKTGIVIGKSPVRLDVDVPASPVPLTATVNGQKPPLGRGLGVLMFFSETGRDQANVALVGSSDSTSDSSSPALLVPGTYEVHYSRYRAGADVPNNSLGDLGCYRVP